VIKETLVKTVILALMLKWEREDLKDPRERKEGKEMTAIPEVLEKRVILVILESLERWEL